MADAPPQLQALTKTHVQPQMMDIQLAYAMPEQPFLVDLTVPVGTTLEQVIQASGVLQLYPQIVLATDKTGIFGKIRALDTVVRDGDRVEIYRSLQADPMESRRRRARHKAASSGGKPGSV